MIGDQRIDGAVSQRGRQRIAVALLAQHGHHTGAAVEVADIVLGQQQRVDGHVGGHVQTFGLGSAHQLHAGGAGDAAQVNPGLRATDQLEDGVQRNRLCRHGHPGQTHAGGQRAAGSHAPAQILVLRAQPHGVAKGVGVAQRTAERGDAGQRHIRLAEGHAAGLGQLGHLGQGFALEAYGQRAHGEQTRLVLLLGTELEHFHQALLVKHRLGIGRADQAGHAAGHGSRHLGLQHAFMLVTGLAQTHGQVHQTRQHPLARGVDFTLGHKTIGHRADGGDHAAIDGDIGLLVETSCRVHHPAIANQNLHGLAPNWLPALATQALAATKNILNPMPPCPVCRPAVE